MFRRAMPPSSVPKLNNATKPEIKRIKVTTTDGEIHVYSNVDYELTCNYSLSNGSMVVISGYQEEQLVWTRIFYSHTVSNVRIDYEHDKPESFEDKYGF